jgi:hypothetical protein
MLMGATFAVVLAFISAAVSYHHPPVEATVAVVAFPTAGLPDSTVIARVSAVAVMAAAAMADSAVPVEEPVPGPIPAAVDLAPTVVAASVVMGVVPIVAALVR